jgi:Ni2+-binding GTPase involved in maturation of urease and hydrogenase
MTRKGTKKMNLHIVSGFLGSGKTTAIIGAAKHLMAQGKRVGVVTNDQGKYLVDTAFFELSRVPTVEVTGGCFCCNYDDLDARLDQLQVTAQPDVIFAESVGSCADIVATVVKPLLALKHETMSPTSFSVFTDSRLLQRRLKNLPLPFSDNVVYIFDKQIEEAGLLVINKVDLLSEDKVREIQHLARDRFPNKPIRLQNSLDPASIADWVDMLTSGEVPLPSASLDIDYTRYGDGEAQLAWLDEVITLQVPQGQGRAVILTLIEGILGGIRQREIAVGHLKFFVRRGSGVRPEPVEDVKISFSALPDATSPTGDSADGAWQTQIPVLTGTQVTLLVNARVETKAIALRELVQQAIEHTIAVTGATYQESDVAFFHPKFPDPTHRLG